MPLETVTITGADNTTSIIAMQELSQEFPFLEWGILLGSHQGIDRFPSRAWLVQLLQRKTPEMRLSLHLCGQYVRDILEGRSTPLQDWHGLWHACDRIQLNFHADLFQFDPAKFPDQIDQLTWQTGRRKVAICQMDGTANEGLFEWARRDQQNVVPLFDRSHGSGVTPAFWPQAIYAVAAPSNYPEQLLAHGYAGGLGPHNLATELPKIKGAAQGAPYWIDMETHVRSNAGETSYLDLAKVRTVLQIAQIET